MEVQVAGLDPQNPTATVSTTYKERQRFITADALDRAWRTFKSGLGIDIAISLALVVGPLLTDLKWTAAYWAIIATVAVKTIVQSVVSYILRKRSTPKVGVQV